MTASGKSLPRCITSSRAEYQSVPVVRERLLSVDDSALMLSYRFEEAPLPLDNYVASVKLVALTGQDKTLLSWSASFDVREPNDAEHYQALIRSLIVDGHNGLQALLAQH
ncbi:SRPBCC family protein [Pseudomonas sp. 43A]|uniref:SRPBCC family protein n=1 Tax=Pseudomonas sp. 29A TaxID=2759706 RepID=UPI001587AE2F|nr:SRPBCC family protein [Pseudomonas sp. 43A]QMW07700.1 SRPBCC family protein [Pseudomonas sp. 29A]